MALLSLHAQPQRVEPHSEPMLRLEMGGHTDTINGFAVDPGEHWAVTVSDDHTARLWDITRGRLLTVLRPPSNMAVGKLYAAAINSDGDRIVVAGITDSGWYGGNAAFVFNRQGRLLRVLEGIQGTIKRIVFSAGDRLLVVSAFGGIRIFDGRNFNEIAGIKDKLSREPEDLAVSKDGAIAYAVLGSKPVHGVLVLCREESRQWTCDQEAVTHDQNLWSTPVFSKDGSKLAAGERGFYSNSKVPGGVHVFATAGLEPITNLTIEGAELGEVYGTEWTPGDCISAAMKDRVRFWPSAGRSGYRDLPVSGAMALQPSGSCGVYVLTRGADPALYRFDGRSGQRVSLLRPRAEAAPMWLGRVDDWKDVAVPREGQPVAPVFHLAQRATAGTVPQVAYTASMYNAMNPAQLAKQLQASGGFNGISNVFALEDRSALIVSHSAQLLRLNADGRVLWSVPAPNAAKRLAVSADRKVVVGFFPDGVIRWYRFTDGKEFLALFQHPDQTRWVLWTPSGYYDAGPGGDGLIGWQLNQGRTHSADFFPVSRFRETFYRPDVIDEVLDTLDESLALAHAKTLRRHPPASVAEVLPPVVELFDSQQMTAVTV